MKIIIPKFKKDVIILLLLVITFLLIRIPILFTFQGVLGGDETYEINKIIQHLLKGDLNLTTYGYYNPDAFHYAVTIPQIPFTLPFYLLFQTNEFSSFLGTTFVSIIILVFLFLFLSKYFNRSTAILCCLMFIISPIGFTISTLAEDASGNTLSLLLLLIPFFAMFFNKNKKIRYWSMILLAFLPVLRPYHFILWPCCMIYILLENHFHSQKSIIEWKELKPYLIKFLIGVIIFSPAYFLIIQSIRGLRYALNYGFIDLFSLNRIGAYLVYLKRLFIYDIFSNNNFIESSIKPIMYISLVIYLVLLISSIVYIISKSIKIKKIKPIFIFGLYPLAFIIVEFFFSNRFLDIAFRTLSISTHFLILPLFMSFILISFFVYHKKNFRIMAYLFILLNLIINLSTITSLDKNNNFINYNLGYINVLTENLGDLPEKYSTIVLTDKIINLSMLSGIYSRELERKLFQDYDLDYKLHGFGLKLFYNNSLGINFCNFLPDKNETALCKEGYTMEEKEFEAYIMQFNS